MRPRNYISTLLFSAQKHIFGSSVLQLLFIYQLRQTSIPLYCTWDEVISADISILQYKVLKDIIVHTSATIKVFGCIGPL